MDTSELFAEAGASGLFSVHYWYTHHHGAYRGHHHPHRGSHKPRPGERHKRGPEKHPRRKGLKHPHKGVHEHHKYHGRHYYGRHHRSHAELVDELMSGGQTAPVGVVMQGAFNAPVNRSITEPSSGLFSGEMPL